MYSTSKRFEIRILWDVIGKTVNSFSQPYKSFKLGDLRIPKEPGNKKCRGIIGALRMRMNSDH